MTWLKQHSHLKCGCDARYIEVGTEARCKIHGMQVVVRACTATEVPYRKGEKDAAPAPVPNEG